MKAVLIKWLLPIVLDMVISTLQRLAHESDNTIDDEMVGTLIANKQKIEDTVKSSL